MEEIIVPVMICAVLPIAVVLIHSLARINADNKRAEILIKAIEANNDLDANRLAESLRKPRRSQREWLNIYLLLGIFFTLLGVVFMVFCILEFIEYGIIGYIEGPFIMGGVSMAAGIGFLVVYRSFLKYVKKQENQGS